MSGFNLGSCWGCGRNIPELITAEGKFEFRCTVCGCSTKAKEDLFEAQDAWNEGYVYAPDDFWAKTRRGEL